MLHIGIEDVVEHDGDVAREGLIKGLGAIDSINGGDCAEDRWDC